MSDNFKQLISVRIQNIADGADGHNNESALYETAFDNPLDVNASNLTILVSEEKLTWCILDNGPGIPNIYHLWGTGAGIKIKSGDKIGTKIAGEFSSCIYFQPDRILYFSRCIENSHDRKHQQLNASVNNMVKIVKTPGMDLNKADNLILKGSNKLLRKPEPDDDSFDAGNVNYVKGLFENNEEIETYFKDETRSGMLKVFKYEEENKYRFLSLLKDLTKIFEKAKFITYNTMKGFRGDKIFKCVNVNTNTTTIINKETCKENFILGKRAIADPNDEDLNQRAITEDENFGFVTEKALTITNRVFKKNDKFYIHCHILDFDVEFLISEDEPKKYLGDDTQQANLKNSICADENLVCETQMYLSFVEKTEAEEQAVLLGENSTLELLKQCYIYYNGRYINKCKIPRNMGTGIQERSLPHFRIVICLNEHTTPIIKLRSNKTLISLDTAHPIFQKQMVEILKPILKLKGANIISTGIDDWSEYENEVLTELGVIPQPVVAPVPVVHAPAATTISNASNFVQQTTGNEVPIAPPTSRGPAPTVLSALNKAQAIQELRRIKSEAEKTQITTAHKSKILTKFWAIEKEIILQNEDMFSEKIDSLIEIITAAEIAKNVRNAAALQEILR